MKKSELIWAHANAFAVLLGLALIAFGIPLAKAEDLPIANLQIQNLNFDMETYQITWATLNTGTLDAPASHTSVTVNGVTVKNKNTDPILAADHLGQQYILTKSPELLDWMEADETHFDIKICVDSRREVLESNEAPSDNCASLSVDLVPMALPDLRVLNYANLNFSDGVLTINYSLGNDGEISVPSMVDGGTVDLLLSLGSGEPITLFETPWESSEESVDYLLAGSQVDFSKIFNFDELGIAPDQDYQLEIRIDPGNKIESELSNENNSVILDLKLAPEPGPSSDEAEPEPVLEEDSVLDEPEIDPEPELDEVPISEPELEPDLPEPDPEIHAAPNGGTQALLPDLKIVNLSWTDDYELIAEIAGADDEILATLELQGLKAWSTGEDEVLFDLKEQVEFSEFASEFSGQDLTVTVCLDPENTVAEKNENNNCKNTSLSFQEAEPVHLTDQDLCDDAITTFTDFDSEDLLLKQALSLFQCKGALHGEDDLGLIFDPDQAILQVYASKVLVLTFSLTHGMSHEDIMEGGDAQAILSYEKFLSENGVELPDPSNPYVPLSRDQLIQLMSQLISDEEKIQKLFEDLGANENDQTIDRASFISVLYLLFVQNELTGF